jgi:hypothetical protein
LSPRKSQLLLATSKDWRFVDEKIRKRQFARQIEKWGFRKNVSSSERRRILQSLAGRMNEPVPELVDRRLKATKLENWKRRYRSDMSEKINGKEESDNKGELCVSAQTGALTIDAKFFFQGKG